MCASAATLRPLMRSIFPNFSHDKADGYQKGQSSPHGSSNGGPYSVRDVELASASQERLKEEALAAGAHSGGYYETADYARHPGGVSQLSTSIYGGRAARPTPFDVRSDSVEGSGRGQKKIRVTRETTMQETREDGV